MAEPLDPRVLCSLDDVKEHTGGFDEIQVEHDDLLTREVNAASSEIHLYAKREFVARNQTRASDGSLAPLTVEKRVFRLRADGFVDEDTFEWVLVVGDLRAKPTLVEVREYDGTVSATLDSSGEVDGALTSEPLRREPFEPFGELRFNRGLAGSLTLSRTQTVEVTALWGFPSVPPTIRKAAYTQAGLWYARDVRKYATVFSLEQGRFQVRPRPLDDAIREMVEEFKVRRV